MKYLFEYMGYDVSVVNDGYTAIDLAKKNNFDVALIDIKMPEINGVETLHEIKKIQPLIRAIMMTAYSLNNLIEQAKKLGALDVLIKPIKAKDVLDIIEKQ